MSSQNTIVVYVDSELEELIPQFLANQQKALATMHAALGRQNYETIRQVGHGIKGRPVVMASMR